ncbi:hypothetical protein [Pseudomonas aeruginosa]|uniref:hypothetical protein n=1 Tax=Pseudomonas aeruginosa TaxID=287 RepID=UPI000E319E01|nr:hypothetical protein [Pseudomonas aeruginosa]NQC29464.1 hypothetical protein [Pseudomonas aeruginosa]
MTESKICTCPSGDGSLRHPCPAHPAEQAGGDERASKPGLFCRDCGSRLMVRGVCSIYCPNCVKAQVKQAEAERPEVFGLERYRVEKTGQGFWPYCVRAGDGTRELFAGHLKQCKRVAAQLATAFEDGKFVAGALRAENAKLSEALDRWPLIRDSLKLRLADALARVAALESKLAELEKQEPVAWGAFHFGGKRDGKLYTHCETEAQIEAYILDMHRSSDSLTLRKGPLYAAPVDQAQHSVPKAWLDVQAERRRQITAEGWTPEHDDLYCAAELPRAAAAYILNGANDEAPAIWPFVAKWWKPRDARSNYVRASALILAEIERLDRACISQSPQPGATTASS